MHKEEIIVQPNDNQSEIEKVINDAFLEEVRDPNADIVVYHGVVSAEDSTENSTETHCSDGLDESSHNELAKDMPATAVYGKFSFGDLRSYLEDIPKLSFFEACQVVKDLDRYREMMETLHQQIEAGYEMMNEMNESEQDGGSAEPEVVDTLARDVAIKNMGAEMLNDTEIDVEDFTTRYAENLALVDELRAKAQEIVDAGTSKKSTAYITEQMIRALLKEIENLNPERPNYKNTLARVETISYAFMHRDRFEYLKNRLAGMVSNKGIVRDMNRAMKNFKRRDLKGLHKIVSDGQIDCLEYYLERCCEANQIHVSIVPKIMYLLSRIALAEQNSGNDIWVKILILNLVDIEALIYDIGDPLAYLHGIEFICEMIHRALNCRRKAQIEACVIKPIVRVRTMHGEWYPATVECMNDVCYFSNNVMARPHETLSTYNWEGEYNYERH